jgi:hypothetical protein
MALSLAKDPGHISFLMTPSQTLIDFADPDCFAVSAARFATIFVLHQ